MIYVCLRNCKVLQTVKSGWTKKKASRRLSGSYSMKIILKKWYYDPKWKQWFVQWKAVQLHVETKYCIFNTRCKVRS